MTRFTKLVWIASQWLAFRLAVYLPWARPHRLTIVKPIHIDFWSVVACDKLSRVALKNVSIRRSSVLIYNSSVSINDATFDNATIRISESQATCEGPLRIVHCPLFCTTSRLIAGRHTLLDGRPTKTLRLPAGVYIRDGSLLMGQNVKLEARVSIQGGEMSIGSHVMLNAGTEVRCEQRISIGNYVLISYEVLIFDTNTHSTDHAARRREFELGFPNSTAQDSLSKPRCAPVLIGDDVWVGMRAAILKGSQVGDRAIVAAGCVVTRTLPSDCVVYGNPCLHKKTSPADVPPREKPDGGKPSSSQGP